MSNVEEMAAEIERLRENIRQINERQGRVVTCVYCGHVYGPDGTPTAKTDMLTKHVAECPQHPMKVFVDLAQRTINELSQINADSTITKSHLDRLHKLMRDFDSALESIR